MLFPSLSLANDFALNGYFETGRRSQAEDFEEEDEDREYTYQNYHLRLKHRFSDRLAYEVGSFIYNKDYRSQDLLDNISKIFNTKGSYYLRKQKRGSLKLDIKLKYKEKRYRNTPLSEYDQIMFSPELAYDKDSYVINLSTGINNYDYIFAEENDQLKFFSKLKAKRYLLEKKLMLTSLYKFETTAHQRAGRQKNKDDFMFGFDYIFKIPFIYKIAARARFGQRDTKDEDERDEDFDYEYRQFYIKTGHRINPKVKTDLKYQYFRKDYLTAGLDHSGFYIQNSWRYSILDDDTQGLYFNFIVKHKDVNYAIKSDSEYKKETLEMKGTYRKKKNYETSASLRGDFYNYRDSSNDRDRYYAILSFEKLFPEKDLRLSLNFKYRYTDNKQAADTEEESVRLAFEHKF
jgi:hypothetical protein